jgi:hypothetical protein
MLWTWVHFTLANVCRFAFGVGSTLVFQRRQSGLKFIDVECQLWRCQSQTPPCHDSCSHNFGLLPATVIKNNEGTPHTKRESETAPCIKQGEISLLNENATAAFYFHLGRDAAKCRMYILSRHFLPLLLIKMIYHFALLFFCNTQTTLATFADHAFPLRVFTVHVPFPVQ